MTEQILLSPDQCAEAMGIGRSMIFEMLRRGEIESIKVGRRRLIPRDALEEFVRRERAAQAV